MRNAPAHGNETGGVTAGATPAELEIRQELTAVFGTSVLTQLFEQAEVLMQGHVEVLSIHGEPIEGHLVDTASFEDWWDRATPQERALIRDVTLNERNDDGIWTKNRQKLPIDGRKVESPSACCAMGCVGRTYCGLACAHR